MSESLKASKPTDTPRTDAEHEKCSRADFYSEGKVSVEFARQLERELTKAVANAHSAQQAALDAGYRMLEMQDSIRSLRDTLSKASKWV